MWISSNCESWGKGVYFFFKFDTSTPGIANNACGCAIAHSIGYGHVIATRSGHVITTRCWKRRNFDVWMCIYMVINTLWKNKGIVMNTLGKEKYICINDCQSGASISFEVRGGWKPRLTVIRGLFSVFVLCHFKM